MDVLGLPSGLLDFLGGFNNNLTSLYSYTYIAIGMCDPKGYGFSAVLVINRV